MFLMRFCLRLSTTGENSIQANGYVYLYYSYNVKRNRMYTGDGYDALQINKYIENSGWQAFQKEHHVHERPMLQMHNPT